MLTPSPIQVKVCGITSTADLQELSKAGVEYAGLIFDERSPRFAGNKIKASSARISKGRVKTVGVFVNAQAARIAGLVEEYGLNLVQLHGEEDPDFCQSIRKLAPVIRAIRVGAETGLDEAAAPFLDCCDFLLFDTRGPKQGGNGILFDWKLLETYRGRIPFFLSGGIGLSEISKVKALHHPALFAVDVNSRFESAPGIKKMDLVREFARDLRAGGIND